MPLAAPIAAVAGGAMSAQGAKSAGNAQVQGGRDAIAAQLAMYNQSRADTLPYQTTGVGALNMLAQMYGLPTYQGGTAGQAGGITFTGGETKQKKRNWFDKITDPANLAGEFGGTSYDPMGFFSSGTSTSPMQFQIADGGGGTAGQQGTVMPGTGTPDFNAFWQTPDFLVARDTGLDALDRSAAASGALYSGGADADRMRYASELGTQAFGNFTGNLFRLAGFGEGANQRLNSLGENFGNRTANIMGDVGNARASSYLRQADAWGNALGAAGAGINQLGQSRGWWGG